MTSENNERKAGLDKAVTDCLEAVRKNPKDDNALCDLGHAIFDLADFIQDKSLFEKSLEKYKDAATLNPQNSEAFNLSLIHI